MAKYVNLFVKVGRADKRCLGSFEGEKPVADAAALFAEATESAKLTQSGVAPDRVEFTREYHGYTSKGKQ